MCSAFTNVKKLNKQLLKPVLSDCWAEKSLRLIFYEMNFNLSKNVDLSKFFVLIYKTNFAKVSERNKIST